MSERLRSRRQAVVWALENNRLGNNVGLFVWRVVTRNPDAGRRGHVLLGARQCRVRGMQRGMPAGQAGRLQGGGGPRGDVPPLLDESKMRVQLAARAEDEAWAGVGR
jgi:hypothetical protein